MSKDGGFSGTTKPIETKKTTVKESCCGAALDIDKLDLLDQQRYPNTAAPGTGVLNF